MDITSLVVQQVFIMLVLILTGFVLYKKSVITPVGTKDISGLLLNIVTPCVLVKAYQIDYSPEIVKELLLAFVLSILIHGLYIVGAGLIWRFNKNKEKRISEVFASIYSNCGFMGIPLLSATLGDKGVLLGSAYLAVFNVLVWTHGLCSYGGSAKLISAKNLLKNPGVVGVTISLILFFARVKIGGPVKDIIGYFASLNTPLAMILLGCYLARSDLKKAFSEGGIYIVSFIKLLLFPLATALLFSAMRIESFLATSLVLTAACPAAAIAPIFAEKFDMDTGYPSQIVSVTTLLSVITLPVVAYLFSFIL